MQVFSVQGGDADGGDIFHLCERLLHLVFDFRERLFFVFDEIPFVQRDDHGTPFV